MLFLIRFWSHLTKKDSVKSAIYEIKNVLAVLLPFCIDFWPIRTQEKKVDPDLENTRIRNTGCNIVWLPGWGGCRGGDALQEGVQLLQ